MRFLQIAVVAGISAVLSGALCVLGSIAGLHLPHWNLHLPSASAASVSQATEARIYFAPDQNLEQIDLGMIRSAAHSIDAAMYAFTDREIAEALVNAAQRGVQIRLYRDHDQYREEELRNSGVSELLSRQPNIHVRVKNSRELMHQKVMLVDGRYLREGSANWSISAARYQDNEIRVSVEPDQLNLFERNFRGMWDRAGNKIIQ